MIFKPKSGSRISVEAAQVIGERFVALSQAGPLQPEDVVEDARSPASPLHTYFEWDDVTAAAQHRIAQARYYLRNIQIVRQDTDEGGEQAIRAFHNVTIRTQEEDRRGYVFLTTVMSDEALYFQVLTAERKRLEAIQRTLSQYEALRPVVLGLGKLIDELQQIVSAERAFAG